MNFYFTNNIFTILNLRKNIFKIIIRLILANIKLYKKINYF